MIGYDPFSPRTPKAAASKPAKAKRGKAAAAADDSEMTVTMTLPDGTETPPATLSQLKEAVDTVKGGMPEAPSPYTNGVARDQLRAFVERIERLEEEKKAIGDDIKSVYSESKGCGFDTKALRRVIALRKLDPDERAEQEAILDTYLVALGMMPEHG